METKKAIVKKILNHTKDYTGKFGQMYVHNITMDNGDIGEYHSQKNTCEKFKEGQEADYTIETKMNGKYENTIIKPIAPIGSFQKQTKDPAFEKYKQALIVAQSSMTKAVELAISGKIEMTAIRASAEKFTQYVYDIADKFGKEANNG